MSPPRVLLLSGRSFHSLQVAKELSVDLNADIIGVGSSERSPILQSRYCDQGIELTDDDSLEHQIENLCNQLNPDFILPVGQKWVRILDTLRDEIDSNIDYALPNQESLDIALDKKKTYATAEELGIRIPGTIQYSPQTDVPDAWNYPLILKAREEAGENVIKKVNSKKELDEGLAELTTNNETDQFLLQEYIQGDATYGCGVYAVEGDIKLAFIHKELRSIPRVGGTGTKVKIAHREDVLAETEKLVSNLDWTGIALFEYKIDNRRGPVLMEINPKFWASYALATKNGYRFASHLVADQLDLDFEIPEKNENATMVFPIRELYFLLQNLPDESPIESIFSLTSTKHQININKEDYRAWLFPGGPMQSIEWLFNLITGRSDPAKDL